MRPGQYWDCEDVKLNFSKKVLADFLNALLCCGGQLTSHIAFSSPEERRWADSWACRIYLPEGTKEKFERLSGMRLDPPQQAGGSSGTCGEIP